MASSSGSSLDVQQHWSNFEVISEESPVEDFEEESPSEVNTCRKVALYVGNSFIFLLGGVLVTVGGMTQHGIVLPENWSDYQQEVGWSLMAVGACFIVASATYVLSKLMFSPPQNYSHLG